MPGVAIRNLPGQVERGFRMGIQEMHAFTVRPPYVSASEPNLCDPRDAPWFMLGLPHLDGSGLSLCWFLREAGHLHWWSMADYAGRSPNGMKDADGNRALPGVTAVVISGRPEEFREDDVVELKRVQRPSPLNGWRSVTELRSVTGAMLSVELVTSFMVREGVSNHALAPARMPGALLSERGTMTSRRTDHIRRMGSKARREALAIEADPVLSVKISSHLHYNGVGLTCFAAMHDMFIAAEASMDEVSTIGPVAHRRVHYYGNADAGETLDIVTVVEERLVEGSSRPVMTSFAKRRADGLVVAVCESVFGH